MPRPLGSFSRATRLEIVGTAVGISFDMSKGVSSPCIRNSFWALGWLFKNEKSSGGFFTSASTVTAVPPRSAVSDIGVLLKTRPVLFA